MRAVTLEIAVGTFLSKIYGTRFELDALMWPECLTPRLPGNIKFTKKQIIYDQNLCFTSKLICQVTL